MLLNIILRLLHSISITLKAKRFKNGVVFHSLARSIFDDADTMLPIRDILLRLAYAVDFWWWWNWKQPRKKHRRRKKTNWCEHFVLLFICHVLHWVYRQNCANRKTANIFFCVCIRFSLPFVRLLLRFPQTNTQLNELKATSSERIHKKSLRVQFVLDTQIERIK